MGKCLHIRLSNPHILAENSQNMEFAENQHFCVDFHHFAKIQDFMKNSSQSIFLLNPEEMDLEDVSSRFKISRK